MTYHATLADKTHTHTHTHTYHDILIALPLLSGLVLSLALHGLSVLRDGKETLPHKSHEPLVGDGFVLGHVWTHQEVGPLRGGRVEFERWEMMKEIPTKKKG